MGGEQRRRAVDEAAIPVRGHSPAVQDTSRGEGEFELADVAAEAFGVPLQVSQQIVSRSLMVAGLAPSGQIEVRPGVEDLGLYVKQPRTGTRGEFAKLRGT